MIPNYLAMVEACKTKYPDAWKHAHMEGDPRRLEFIQLCAADIHAIDGNVACNGKRGNAKDLSADALNILCTSAESSGRTPEGLPCVVVDVIQSAGSTDPNNPPKPIWSVYTTLVEGSGANVLPGAVAPPVPSKPVYPPYPGDEPFDAIGVTLFADYARAGQAPNPQMGRWFGRVCYDWLTGVCPTLQASIDKHRAEWCAILGIPV